MRWDVNMQIVTEQESGNPLSVKRLYQMKTPGLALLGFSLDACIKDLLSFLLSNSKSRI